MAYCGGPEIAFTEREIAEKPVTDEEYDLYMKSDNCDISIEEVEFFLPEFSE